MNLAAGTGVEEDGENQRTTRAKKNDRHDTEAEEGHEG
jgi:hypothetical protein